MFRKVGMLLVFILMHNLCPGAPGLSFTFDPLCAKAYHRIMALKLQEGNIAINTAARNRPDNFIPYYLADYADCLELLFNGDIRQLEPMRARAEKRLDMLEAADDSSPWYRYSQAGIYFHWALVYMRFGDNFKAATRFRKSFLLLKENLKKYPAFEENNVLLGLEMASAGAIPASHQWLASLMGIKGDIQKGVSLLAQYSARHEEGSTMLYEEAFIFEAYLRFYLLSQQDAAWKSVLKRTGDTKDNLMYTFVRANLALNFRKADHALNTLTIAERNEGFARFPIFLYEKAEALLLRTDKSSEDYYLSFLKNYKGKPFVKDAYLKLSWQAILSGRKSEAQAFLMLLKGAGNTLTDADKQAQRFAEKPVWPALPLLETRLLIDGGYYQQALRTIQQLDYNSLTQLPDQIEYYFRYGRILEELNEPDKAIAQYTTTIQLGQKQSYYFAARAALQQGFIYERSGRKDAAAERYKFCLSLRDHDMQNSIDQMAKAGLNRLQR
ncbi:hypothetical protein [Rurimicrobium arvi]